MEPKSVLLFHWNAAKAAKGAAQLRRAGYQCTVYSGQGAAGLRCVGDDPPDAFVVDLSHLPSHGRAVAVLLRQRRSTRSIPIVFVGGDAEKVACTRQLLPDAEYSDWRHIRGVLRRAITSPLREPVVPGTMDEYAGRPLTTKLGIRPGFAVALLGAPAGFDKKLGKLPANVRLLRRSRVPVDLVLLFVRSRAELKRRFQSAVRAVAEGGALWIAWPKKASGVSSDLTQTVLRSFCLQAGLVDNKVCAVTDVWSGLRFTRRKVS